MCCESVVNRVFMGSERLKNQLKVRLSISSKRNFFCVGISHICFC